MITEENKEFIELSLRHKEVMEKKNIIISIYTSASGFLWQIMKVDSGTDLGWSEYDGDCEMSGTFTSYPKALKHALDLIDLSSLDEYRENEKESFHWGNFALYLRELKKRRNQISKG